MAGPPGKIIVTATEESNNTMNETFIENLKLNYKGDPGVPGAKGKKGDVGDPGLDSSSKGAVVSLPCHHSKFVILYNSNSHGSKEIYSNCRGFEL